MVRNIVFESKLLPGGGATEMAVSQALARYAACLSFCFRNGDFFAAAFPFTV